MGATDVMPFVPARNISIEECVNRRNTIGAPGPESMKEVIEKNEAYLRGIVQ